MSAPAVESARARFLGGDPAGARAALRRYLSSRPNDPEAACLLAEVLEYLGQHTAALVFASRVAAVLPGDAHARIMHARVLASLGRDAEADAEFDAAEQIAPAAPEVARARPTALIRAGRTVEAAHAAERALEKFPDDLELLQGRAFTMHLLGDATPDRERVIHERLSRSLGRGLLPGPRSNFPNSPDTNRPLRVAFLSSDFRTHSCAYFLAPLIAALDRGRVTTYLYSTTREPDAVSDRFMSMGAWREVASSSADEAVALARRDQIDILIECGGWTSFPQLRAVLRRLAPVQISYLGYPNTTGVPTMDARLVDSITDPPGCESAASERLIRLPGCFLCYGPPSDLPSVGSTPFQQGRGPLTFGCFNNALKIGPLVIQTWSELLRRIPEARLMLKAPGLAGARAVRLLAELERAGTPSRRVEILPFAADHRGHLGHYSEIDVALDTFPYNGTTTTCEALCMGVPVVTMRGDRHRARVGASLLEAAGLPECVARDTDAYVELCVTVAASRDRSATNRAERRSRVAASRLCDANAHAGEFERAVREAWKDWCQSREGDG